MCTLTRIFTGLLILWPAGCAFFPVSVPAAALSQRILPPPGARDLPQPGAELLPPRALPSRAPPGPTDELPQPRRVPDAETAPRADCAESGPLTLEVAIDLALRLNPNLEFMSERVAQAEAGQTISFADFLPESRLLYRHIQGSPPNEPFALPTLPTNFVGNVAFGGQSDRFDLSELHVQWTVFDFGLRAARYGQAKVAVEVARLQYRRARQTVAFDVTSRYLATLRAEATARVAEEAVRRAESDLRDARNFQRRGTGIRNDVLRAEAFLAESRLALIRARTERSVAVAGLNQAIGINVSTPTRVVDRSAAPAFAVPLGDCLQLAVGNREEFGVVLDTIRSARLGVDASRADFMPRLLVGGLAAHQETDPHTHSDLVAGGLAIELFLFEGGRRVGRLRSAESEARGAVARGKEVCDRISYEVNVAHVEIADARERVTQTEIAARAASENLRVVRGLLERGDATPTDVVDAELALTRAEEGYYTALYDYQVALARLAYAVGLPVLSDLSARAGGPCHE